MATESSLTDDAKSMIRDLDFTESGKLIAALESILRWEDDLSAKRAVAEICFIVRKALAEAKGASDGNSKR